MVAVEQAIDLKMVASAFKSLRLKKWACRLTDGHAVDEIFTKLVSNYFFMFLFSIYKQRYKSEEIKKITKMSAENGQMVDLSPLVGKRQYLITYAHANTEKFPARISFGEAIEE